MHVHCTIIIHVRVAGDLANQGEGRQVHEINNDMQHELKSAIIVQLPHSPNIKLAKFTRYIVPVTVALMHLIPISVNSANPL